VMACLDLGSKLEVIEMECPLCGGEMIPENGHLNCRSNTLHVLNMEKEVKRFESGEKDRAWLQFRMKVRLGKMVHRR